MVDTLFKMKKDDTRPYLKVTVTDENGDAVSLVSATVKFSMTTDDDTRTAKVSEQACNITDESNGVAEYRWSASDTDTAGDYLGEFQVTLSDSTVFTVPNDDSLKIKIRADYV